MPSNQPLAEVLTSRPDAVEVKLPPAPLAPGLARRSLEPLQDAAAPEVVDDLRLLVTELITNSVKHGDLRDGDPILLRVHLRDDVVRVEVEDAGRGFDGARDPVPGAGSGWGLYLVERISDRWGVSRVPGDGMSVWFEIDVNRAA